MATVQYQIVRLHLVPAPTRQDPDNHRCLVQEMTGALGAKSLKAAIAELHFYRQAKRNPWELALAEIQVTPMKEIQK